MDETTLDAPRVSRPVPRAPLTGRERELKELDDALAKAITDLEPQTVTVIGGAGMGKGRLVVEFLDRVDRETRKTRYFRGLAKQGGPTLGLVQRLLRARFGITDSTSLEDAREMLRAAVSELLDDRRVTEYLHFLGAYLDVSFPDSPFTKALEGDAEQLSRIHRAVLRSFLEADARHHGPMILTFEEIDQAHDETLELVRYLSETLTAAPILVIVSARPQLMTRRPGWVSGARHRRIQLAPLSPEDATKMVAAILEPAGEASAELVEAAVDMAGGSPYLLEQAVRTFFESGTLTPREDGTWEVELDRLDDAYLPMSVDDAIAARIASLGPNEREVLERAAAMGSVFWLGALVTLGRIDKDPPNLWGGAEDLAAHYRDLLAQLADRDYVMLFEDSSISGEEEYAFKHNLERDAVEKLIHQDTRRRYHRRVAEWLEFRLSDRGEEAFDLLASHYEAADAPHQAAYYYLAAGDRARQRYANAKAADYYERGIRLLGDKDVVRLLDAHHNFGDVLQLLGRNDDATRHFRKMLVLAYRLDLKSKGGAAHNRIGRVYRAVGQLEEAMRNLGTGHALFDAAGDQRGVASSLDDVGKVHWMRGAYESAESFMRRGLDLRREIGDERSIALSLNNLGLVYQDSGRFENALASFNEALSLRRKIGDAAGMAQTLNNLGTIYQDNEHHEKATELWNEALEYARMVGDRMREAVILTNLGESGYRQGRPDEAIETLKKAEEISAHLGDRILEAEILRGLAKAHMLRRDHAAAKDYVARALALFEKAKSKPFVGTTLRTLAEIESAQNDPEALTRAETAFRKSLAIFEEVGNDVELAKTCEAFSEFLERTAGSDEARMTESYRLRDRALEVHGKQLASETYQLPPLDGEETNPGVLPPGA
ncbi:MAG: tetratricopeptide repeat protein [Sandaracinaceae bacterium]